MIIIDYDPLEMLLSGQSADSIAHARNVASLSAELANLNGWAPDLVDSMYLGALLHDIGKQFVHTKIMNKTSKLNPTEFEQVKLHPLYGHDYLLHFDPDEIILKTVLYHHENWDGQGYPFKLSEDSIPLAARICAVADGWDAMITDRYYRNALSMNEALNQIWNQAGQRYDPYLVEVFMWLIREHAKTGRLINGRENELFFPNTGLWVPIIKKRIS